MLSIEMITASGRRRERLAGELDALGVDALLIGHDIDIRYLTGFNGDDSLLLVRPGQAWIISDSRYDEYLDPWREAGEAGLDVVMGTRHRLDDTVRTICVDQGIGRLGIQAESTTILGRSRLAKTLGETTIVDTDSVVPGLRRRKDPDEIAAIERAVATQQDALSAALERVHAGMRESELAAVLEYEIRRRGSTASFPPIVATGVNSSVIHHTTGSTPIGDGCLLIDWGATSDFLCSDMTRTFLVGDVPDRVRAMYEIVLEAQLAAIDACRPGRTCAEIDDVARSVITRAGYGDAFGHGLGHALGLEVHESPYFNALETTTRLEPGMVMTVEPGIYVPGVGGVRIEDDVLVTEDGARVLGSMPKRPEDAALRLEGAGEVTRT